MSLLTSLFEQELHPFLGKEVWIAVRRDSAKGSGTAFDPYNGSTQEMLDELLSDPLTITSNMTIHFGPGIFQTRGFGALVTGFEVFGGQRFVGAGMHQTTLQIIKAVPDPAPQRRDGVGVFGTELNVADVEISDMTLDCNLSRQANYPAQMTGVGVAFPNGSRIKLKRVRIINWGTQTRLDEGFPVYIVSQGGGAIGEAVIEDCIVEQPALSQARESTLLLTRASLNSPLFLATIRNCYVNCDYTTGSPPLPVEVSRPAGPERRESGSVRSRSPKAGAGRDGHRPAGVRRRGMGIRSEPASRRSSLH